ncbi:hypothetical protein BC477_02315 [Clavibacter michiganensis subsp. michiganensis]|uniref:Secreted protein n=1 Tax=Clavibacter michiganensis subsp. michiganensis TaxID=33013 RepID=A0A251XJ07_CLAMM|nr:hypothetical protein BC477_02315 [Clavibacter michiganensis subsp. michiganensis]OUE03544.1 hypothetical protein CMMCAS07_01250 [Clavibacter michiganensis subsp. michiganensis]
MGASALSSAAFLAGASSFFTGAAGAASAAGRGRDANVSNAVRGVSRASSETMSRPQTRLFTQPVTTRALRSKDGIARPW